MTDSLTSEDRIRDEALASIVKSGRCYTGEARAMAIEIIKRRAAEATPARPHYPGDIIGGTP
jgi:hypothetical protein